MATKRVGRCAKCAALPSLAEWANKYKGWTKRAGKDYCPAHSKRGNR